MFHSEVLGQLLGRTYLHCTAIVQKEEVATEPMHVTPTIHCISSSNRLLGYLCMYVNKTGGHLFFFPKYKTIFRSLYVSLNVLHPGRGRTHLPLHSWILCFWAYWTLSDRDERLEMHSAVCRPTQTVPCACVCVPSED